MPRPPKVGYVYDDQMLLHREHRDKGHPERPERLMAVYLNLVKKGIFKDMVEIDSEEASEQDLLLCHPAKHVNNIMRCGIDKQKDEDLLPKQNQREFASDTYTNKHTAQAALIAAGSTIEATKAVCTG